jgi:predicted metalloprotease with PDZ domain
MALDISLSDSSFSAPSLSYRVSMPHPTNHRFEIEAQVHGEVGYCLELKMAVWTPGSYLVREYSRHIQDFAVRDESGKALSWKKISKNHWRIDSREVQGPIVFSYSLYANELTVRTNHLDRTHGYFNGASTFLYIPGKEAQPIDVTIVTPEETWSIATTLPEINPNTFRAADFNTLVDSPFEIGLQSKFEFEVLGKPHEWVIWGKGNVDPQQLIVDTRKIIETEAKLFGGLPYDRYLFLLHLSNGYGGLEHRDSCSLIFSRNGFKKRESYEDFLTLVAHEFFHLWNVKRIRPKELETFDYDGENYTPSLWFSEGATSFYDNLIPLRAGLYDARTYLKNLSKTITRFLTTPGRSVQPLSESSFDAWIKLYRPDTNTPNSQMSYYLKGELVTFLLDLALRRRHENQRSFDDVMRKLWTEFGQTEGGEVGFTPGDLKGTIEAVAEFDLTSFFGKYIDGLMDLPFKAALADFGLQLESNLGQKMPPIHGARLALENGKTLVKYVASNSPAEKAGLDAGDELVAIDGLRTNPDLITDRLQASQPGDQLEITFFHQDELLQTVLILGEPDASQYTVVPLKDPTEAQQKRFQGWLGCSLQDLGA